MKWVTNKQEGSPWRNSQINRMVVALDKEMSRSAKFDNMRIFIAETMLLMGLYDYTPGMLTQFGEDRVETSGRQLYNFFDEKSPYYVGNLKHVDQEFTAHPYHNHFTSEDMRSTHLLAAAEAKKYGVLVSFDLNYRNLLWNDDRAACSAAVQKILPLVDFLKKFEAEHK